MASSDAASRPAPAPTPSAEPSSAWFSNLLLWLLLFVMAFGFPNPPAIELDSSWRMGLTYFLERGYAFGRDVVFTYGPLGFLLGRTYTGSFFSLLIGWQVIQAAVAATLIVATARDLRGMSRFFYFTFFILFGVGYEDALQMIIIAMTGWWLVRRSADQESPSVALPALFLAVLATIKFTNLLLGGWVVLIAAAFAWRRQRPGAAGRLVVAFAGGFLVTWLACRQPLSAIPAYLWNSLDVSSGYQATMGLPTPFAPLWKALAVAALLGVYTLWHFRTQTDRLFSAANFLILGAYLYLNWKHGFVRADGHIIGFFYCALVPCLAFPVLFRERVASAWWPRVLLVPAVALSVLGVRDALTSVIDYAFGVAEQRARSNLRNFTDWSAFRGDLESKVDQRRREADLPKIRAAIGPAPVDVLGFEQAVAVLNRFNYMPRPVFQSYSAYTPHLADLNARFLTSLAAPEYLIFKLQTLDDRPLTLDDSHVLRILPHLYRFVLVENGYQLWRRRPGHPPLEQFAPRTLTRTTLPLGAIKPLGELASQPLWAEIDLRPSLLGRLRSFAYKPPIVQLKLVDENGREFTYRLPLPAARAGFLLNPHVTDIASYIESQNGSPQVNVRSLQLIVAPGDERYFQKAATVTLSAVTPSNAAPEYHRQLERAKYAMFSAIPDEVEAVNAPTQEEVAGRNSLAVHAPSHLSFSLTPGVTQASGFFGYVPGAYSNGGNTDGAEFSVVWSNDTERRVLFSRLLRPVAEPADRGLQRFEADLRGLPPGGRLSLDISPGPNGDGSWDWTIWTDVEIK